MRIEYSANRANLHACKVTSIYIYLNEKCTLFENKCSRNRDERDKVFSARVRSRG